MRSFLIWTGLVAAVVIPIVVAANSPLLAWRDPVYIAAGLAGIVGLVLLLMQPLLAIALLPGIARQTARQVHRFCGALLLSAVIIHIGALWLTSPPDVIDALLLRSPTPFSLWGVIAMWLVFVSALLAIWRRRLLLRPMLWRKVHVTFGVVIGATTIAHALLIEGTMGTLTKWVLCGLVGIAIGMAAAQVFRRT